MGNQPKTSSKFDTSPYIAVLDTARKLGTVDQNALEALERFKRRIPGLKRKLAAISTKEALFSDGNETLRGDIHLAWSLVKGKIEALRRLADMFERTPFDSDKATAKTLRQDATLLEGGISASEDAFSEMAQREVVDKTARAAGAIASDVAVAARDLSRKVAKAGNELKDRGVKAGKQLVKDGFKAGSKLAKDGLAAAKEAFTGKK